MRRATRSLASVVLCLGVVPVAVYAASYVPWVANYPQTSEGKKVCAEGDDVDPACEVSLPDRLRGLVRYHREVYGFHAGLEAEHTYRAPAYTWPVMGRPVVYYYEACDEDRANRVPRTESDGKVTVPDACVVAQGDAGEIIALGNPVVWWGVLLALVPLIAGAAARDRRAAFVLTFYALQVVPWLGGPLGRRPVFFFYMTPAVVFMALALAYAVLWAEEHARRRISWWAIGAFMVHGAIAGFAARLMRTSLPRTEAWVALLVAELLLATMVIVVSTTGRRRTPGDPMPGRGLTPGAFLGLTTAVLAVGVFVYLYPVLSGVPALESLIRARWWFRGWI